MVLNFPLPEAENGKAIVSTAESAKNWDSISLHLKAREPNYMLSGGDSPYGSPLGTRS